MSWSRITLLALFALTGTFRPTPTRADSPPAVAAVRLTENTWSDLASAERSQITRALMELGAAPPTETVAFLSKRLHPVKDEPDRIRHLIADLDSKELAKRQTAAEELEYLGKFAVPHLKRALASKPPLELRMRLEQVLNRVQPKPRRVSAPMGGYGSQGFGMFGGGNLGGQFGLMGGIGGIPNTQFKPAPPSPPPAVWVRAVWAVGVLEQIGTPDARKMLEHLATGLADDLPTKEAKAALERLARRRK